MKYRIARSTVILGMIIAVMASVLPKRAHTAGRIQPAVREIEVPTGTVTLFVRIAGDPSSGNVLIGINGGPGQSSRYMRGLEELVEMGWAVVTYDQRGTGRSTEPTDGYRLTAYAEDVEAVRRAVGSGKTIIFGHSWGGIIAMHYAALHPGHVRSLILMASGPPARKEVQPGQSLLNQRIADLRERGIIAGEPPESMKAQIQFILPAYFSDPEFPVPAGLRDTDFNASVYRQTMAALGDWDFRAEVAELTLPVLLLWGDSDPFGMSVGEATKNALSGTKVKFVVLTDCGHYWHECPDIFFSHVRTFLGRPPGSYEE